MGTKAKAKTKKLAVTTAEVKLLDEVLDTALLAVDWSPATVRALNRLAQKVADLREGIEDASVLRYAAAVLAAEADEGGDDAVTLRGAASVLDTRADMRALSCD